jgi:cytochrome b561
MRTARTIHWIARIAALAVVAFLLMLATGEGGAPRGASEWLYLAFFPFGFSIAYLLGLRWPLHGGAASLACMALSLIVIGRTFDVQAYVIWGLLCVPGLLYVWAGWLMRQPSASVPADDV